MQIIKWLKDSDGAIIETQWTVIPVTSDNQYGYEIEDKEGKWVTIMSTFTGDTTKNLLSVNPYEINFSEYDYTELTEEEAKEELEKQKLEQEEEFKKIEKEYAINKLKVDIEYLEKEISKDKKILQAVESNVIYEGDLELMEALHGFNEDTISQKEQELEDKRAKLEELDGE